MENTFQGGGDIVSSIAGQPEPETNHRIALHQEGSRPEPEPGLMVVSGSRPEPEADDTLDPGSEIQNLPSVVIANILSFLSCKDKLNTVAAIPSWTEHLRMAAAWHWFCSNSDIAMTRQLLRQLHQMSCWCIRHYGRYFQNCVLVLQYLDLGDMGLELVENVANHCVGLRHFRLYHPDCFTLAEHDMFERYVNLLHSTVQTCRGLKHVALCNLDYLAINKRDGIKELFDRFIEDETHAHITELEFTHAYDYSQPVACLAQFDNLRKLKCPIQVLTTAILCQLASKSLCDIYVLNDGSTLNEDFNEAVSLQWYEVAKVTPVLRVHYIVQGRSFRPENIVSNPLIHTVILDSLCNPIGQDLISALGNMYGDSLRAFGHLATEWNFLPYDDNKLVTFMYRDLVTHCPKLETIATALEMPSSALLLIAANQRIKNLWVDREKVQFDFGEMFDVMDILHQAQGETEYVDWWETLINDMPSLQKVMSRFLRYDWRPLNSEELLEKVRPFVKF